MWATRPNMWAARESGPHSAASLPARWPRVGPRSPTSRPRGGAYQSPPRDRRRSDGRNKLCLQARLFPRAFRDRSPPAEYLLPPPLPRSDSGCKAPGRRCLARQLHVRNRAWMARDPHAGCPLRRTCCAPVAPAPARGGWAQQVEKRGCVVVCSMISRCSRDEPIARKRLQ